MAVLRVPEFAITEPLQVEGKHALQRVVDAALLLKAHRLAVPIVPEQIEDRRRFSPELRWFVEERCGPKPRDNLIPQLANPVAFGCGDGFHLFKPG